MKAIKSDNFFIRQVYKPLRESLFASQIGCKMGCGDNSSQPTLLHLAEELFVNGNLFSCSGCINVRIGEPYHLNKRAKSLLVSVGGGVLFKAVSYFMQWSDGLGAEGVIEMAVNPGNHFQQVNTYYFTKTIIIYKI